MDFNGYTGPAYVRGDCLPDRLRSDALAAYLHRFTLQHVPVWSRKPMPNGTAYSPQFSSDEEWLANTLFPVTVRKGGRLGDHTRGHCRSYATWPHGVPENAGQRPETIPEWEKREEAPTAA